MLATYLNKLKTERNLTNQEISDLSGVPMGTVGRIFSGAAKNPGHDAVVAIVRALGGDLNAAAEIMAAGNENAPQPAQPPASPVADLAGTFNELSRRKDEMHLAVMAQLDTTRQHDADRLERQYNAERQRQHAIIKMLIVILAAIAMAIIVLLIVDIANPSIGWIRREALAAALATNSP